MKIVHTSDWHLGQQLYGYDRSEEHEAMISQIERVVADERPDVLLICGDVYHSSQPSSAVQRMFAEAMVRMHDACPTMTIVVTAGNHDSGSRHEIFRTPWLALNVHAVGNIDREQPESHIIKIKDKGFVVAVPYTCERTLPKEFFLRLLTTVAERNSHSLPVILTAHTTVRGCDFRGHDHADEFSVGGIDSITLEDFGEGYDYLALGHIHHAQFISGSQRRARYSGTPLAVSFDETFAHSVSVVEVECHGSEPKVLTREIATPRPLVTLPTEGAATWEECRRLLSDFPSDLHAYIRLNVLVDDFIPEASAEAERLTAGKACRFCLINAIRERREGGASRALTVQEFQAESPIDIVRRYADDLAMTFDEEMERMFKEIVENVR